MNKREIAVLACKVLGIMTVVSALHSPVNGLLSVLQTDLGQHPEAAWLPLIPILHLLLLFGVGLFLWMCADRLAAEMVRSDESSPAKSVLTGDEIQAIAFSVIGLFLFVQALPRFLYEVVYIGAVYPPPAEFRPRWLLGGPLLQVIVGIALFFGARGLVGIWKKMRGGGVPSPCELPDKPA